MVVASVRLSAHAEVHLYEFCLRNEVYGIGFYDSDALSSMTCVTQEHL